MLGGDNRATSEITKLISQLPPAVQAITGVDLTGVLTNIPGASASAQWRGQKRSWSRFLSDCPRWKVKYRSFCFQYLIISISSTAVRFNKRSLLRYGTRIELHSFLFTLLYTRFLIFVRIHSYSLLGNGLCLESADPLQAAEICKRQTLHCRASKSSIPAFIPVHPVTKLWKTGIFNKPLLQMTIITLGLSW